MSLVCIGTPLSDEELAEAQGDSPPAAVLEHLDMCAFCRAELAAITSFDRQLGAVFSRFECPDPFQLAEYSMGFLAAEERAAITAHVQECAHCAEELASYGEFEPGAAPAPAGHDPAAPGAVRRFVSGMRDILAQLISPPAPLAGLRRGVGPRSYEAPGVHIQLSPRPDAPELVRGKVSRAGSGPPLRLDGALAQLFDPESDLPLATAFVKGNGVFDFDLEPPPGYIVRLSLPEATIVIVSAA
jgi:hypothetical protein